MVRAAICREHGPPEGVLVEDHTVAPAGPGQVGVRVSTAAVNFPDVLLVADDYQVSIDTPFVPGSEFRRSMPASLLAQAKSAVHVHQVEMGGPGQKGGIEQYDVIAAVNGKMVESVDDIYRIIGSKAVGTGGFQVTVIRPMINEWRVVDLTVPFMERPKAALPAQRAVPRLPAGASFE